MKWICILIAFSAHAQSQPKPADAMRASIEKQRQAVRIQAASVGAHLIPWDPPTGTAEFACDPIADSVVDPIIDAAAKQQAVQPKLLHAVIEQESGYHPCAVSPTGAEGLMQLMPATAEQFGVKDAFDPKESIEAGAKFLKQLIDKYKGNLSLALGAYNAGPGTVDQTGGIPDIPETRDYVDAILKKMGLTRTDPPSIPTPKPIGN